MEIRIRITITIRNRIRTEIKMKIGIMQLGKDTRQGAVGFVIDRDYFEIRFPLAGDE